MTQNFLVILGSSTTVTFLNYDENVINEPNNVILYCCNVIPWIKDYKYLTNKDKTQGRRIQSTMLVISDGVAKRDGLGGLTIKELVKGIVSQTERQKDGWILHNGQIPMRWTDTR